jgi:hypothetical protein
VRCARQQLAQALRHRRLSGVNRTIEENDHWGSSK